jgi:murein DD-endopeptidase MepM/ murein hydrolase activator NlpD
MRSTIINLCLVFLFFTSGARANCPAIEGKMIQGGLVWGEVAPGSVVKLDGQTLDVLEDGTFFAGFGRDAAATAELVVEGEQACRQILQVKSRKYNISRVEGVPQKTVTPSQAHMARIKREREWVRAAKGMRLQRPDLILGALAGFEWPATGRISGVYGSQRIYNGTPKSPHYGVDVAVPTGTPVHAPTAGVVTLAEPDLFYSGGTVILDHGYGLSSSFLHLSAVHVEVGQEIRTGDLIGEVGATGRATGPHLDWRMSWRSERVDPELLAPPMPSSP